MASVYHLGGWNMKKPLENSNLFNVNSKKQNNTCFRGTWGNSLSGFLEIHGLPEISLFRILGKTWFTIAKIRVARKTCVSERCYRWLKTIPELKPYRKYEHSGFGRNYSKFWIATENLETPTQPLVIRSLIKPTLRIMWPQVTGGLEIPDPSQTPR